VRWVIARYVRLHLPPASPDTKRQFGHAALPALLTEIVR
jgi:hypothetical protein